MNSPDNDSDTDEEQTADRITTTGPSIADKSPTDEPAEETPVSTSDTTPEIEESEDDFDYESQEWAFGDIRTGEIEVKGMRFKVSEPEEDEGVARLLQQQENLSENLYEVVQTLIDRPVITRERWEEDMTPKDRAVLSNKALQWFGIEDLVDTDRLAEQQEQRDGFR